MDGRRVIDYGNKEYLTTLQYMVLAQPTIHDSLNRLRSRWPTLMDLWLSYKSDQHIERLADVVEIIMGALRAEHWFTHLWGIDRYRNCLPEIFSMMTTLCKIIQSLTARLGTAYLKHKREVVPLFRPIMHLEFSNRWANNHEARGMLLFGLLASIRQAQQR